MMIQRHREQRSVNKDSKRHSHKSDRKFSDNCCRGNKDEQVRECNSVLETEQLQWFFSQGCSSWRKKKRFSFLGGRQL